MAGGRNVLPSQWPMGAYCYHRAIDQHGQIVDAYYFSERRNAAAARAFFERAIAGTGIKPERIVTDHRARCYPPALRAVLPSVDHRCSRYLNDALERDHGHLKQRLRPMRGFKHPASADTVWSVAMPLYRICATGYQRLLSRSPAACASQPHGWQLAELI